MDRSWRLLSLVPICGLGLVALASCADPFPFETTSGAPQATAEEEEICAASSEWLPITPMLDLFKPLPHPATECPFYRGAWQSFLLATQPDPQTGHPALQSYPTIDSLFDSTKPHAAERAWLGDIKQAGGRQILIDQRGHPIYYGIHVNQAYADFIDAHGLRTAEAIQGADPNLFFPAGVIEYKSAWQEVADDDPTLGNYITTTALVSRLKQVGGSTVEDRDDPREITVRLLALHCVFSLPGHPEFIWATFEHSAGAPDLTAADGKRDVAPANLVNPLRTDPNNQSDTRVISDQSALLYRAGTRADEGNQALPENQLVFDEASQSFPQQQTSIYRMFPASKSNSTHPDDAITSLNFNVQTLFANAAAAGRLDPGDKRGHYRLVGAVWMDKPQYFKLDTPLQNDASSPFLSAHRDANGNQVAGVELAELEKAIADEGSDSDLSILAGEDRLSSTAMESFTQAPDSFPNCFSCHNTQAVTAKGVPVDHDSAGTMLLGPKLLNVSHVLSQFLLEESQ